MEINNKHKKEIENRGYIYIGSYDNYEVTIDNKIGKGFVRVQCPYCGTEYDIVKSDFKRGTNCSHCCNKYENSLAYHIQQELKEPLNKYWDWELNTANPYCIYKNSTKKIWLKCTKTDYHGSYEVSCVSFTQGSRCPYCNPFASHKTHPKDSFAQRGIDTFGEDFLSKYWDYEKNIIDPYTISPRSNKKVWIKCQEKYYHGSYELVAANFFHKDKPRRCPYCSHKSDKVHPKDSFGYLYPEKAKYWNYELNDKTPFEVYPNSNLKFWFNCEKCNTPYSARLTHITTDHRCLRCVNCSSSKGEQEISNWLIDNNIDFIPQKEFDGLIGLGNGNLSYDFYLPDYNLLIEFQGEQHEHFAKIFHQTIKDLKKQQEHDRRKKQYALDNNIDLLEIWYYDFNNIDEILFTKLIKEGSNYVENNRLSS